MKPNSLFLTSLFVVFTASVFAENWANWRGPNLNGSSNEKNLPTKFSKTENVKWDYELPGVGASTPVIWNDHVFITSAKEQESSMAIALDRKTGEKLWEKEFPGFGHDDRSNFSAPSAATDGELVIFFFGSGKMAAFDFDGKEIWNKDIEKEYGEFAFQWTFSSSPVLHGDKVFLQVLQRNQPAKGRGKEGAESYLLALDAKSGEEIYRHVRPSNAQMESLESFATPLPLEVNGREELVIVGGDVMTGHNPETGEEIWRWGTWNEGHREQWWRLVPSPVYGDGILLACAPKNAPIYGIKAGLTGTHEGESGLAWVSEPTKQEPITTDVATPLFYEGRFYVVDHGRTRSLSCIEPKTGKVIYCEPLGSREKFEVSPTGADGKIYLMNHLGDVFVVKAGDEFELLHKAEMGDSMRNITRASIAVSQRNLYIRTDTKLFCIGE
ncbi:MAG: PQQ-binding-like beta-propeller repeat protein [Verrucomicrobiales bacterium]|nr:PQQ-binding-like beta-propeller repeat protein [Verrucomicrobiales bacterium]